MFLKSWHSSLVRFPVHQFAKNPKTQFPNFSFKKICSLSPSMVQKKQKSKCRNFKRRSAKMFKQPLQKEKRIPQSVLRTDESTATRARIKKQQKQRSARAVDAGSEKPLLVNSRDPVSVEGDVYMDGASPIADFWKSKMNAKDVDMSMKYVVVSTPYTLILNGRNPNKEQAYGVLGDLIGFFGSKRLCLHFCIAMFNDVDEFVQVFSEEYKLKGWREVASRVFDEMRKGTIYFYRETSGSMNFELKA